MAAQFKNRFLSAAGLALVAGVCGVATPAADAHVDWSFSLNLGWCAPDPCFTPVSVYGGYSNYGGYCSPHWGGYYYQPYYYNCYYPQYAFTQPLYLPSGSTYIYSSYTPWGSGFTYSTQTFYTPYANYYAPAANWGMTLSFGTSIGYGYSNWHNNNWHNDNHWDDHHDHHDHVDHHNSNQVAAPAAIGTTMRSGFGATMNKPTFASTSAAPAAQSFGVAGPAATNQALANTSASKGPRQIAPVAVKPVESQPQGGKPSAMASLPTSKPTSTVARPSLRYAQSAPSKPALPTLTSQGKTPQFAANNTPARTQPSTEQLAQAPAGKQPVPTQAASSWAKPATSDKTAYPALPSTPRTSTMPRYARTSSTMPTSKGPAMASPVPEQVPAFTRSQTPIAPRAATPMPSSPSPAPSASPEMKSGSAGPGSQIGRGGQGYQAGQSYQGGGRRR